MSGFTREELKELLQETVLETLAGLGIDVKKPREMQADFVALREWRLAMRMMRRVLLTTVIGVAVTGAIAAVWAGIKTLVFRKE